MCFIMYLENCWFLSKNLMLYREQMSPTAIYDHLDFFSQKLLACHLFHQLLRVILCILI